MKERPTVWSVVIRNAASGYLKVLVMMGAAFVVTPVLISELGTNDYGLWLLLSAIVGHYLLFDLGFRRALIHDISIRRGQDGEEEIREIVNSFLILFAVIGVIIVFATCLLAVALPSLFSIRAEQVEEARIALLLLGIAWALHLPANIAGGVLLGYERYDAVNGVDSLMRVATAVLSILIVTTGHGIATLAVAVAVIQVAGAVVMMSLAAHFAPSFGLTARAANPRYLRTAFSRSTSYFVISINSLVNTRFDELIIGIVLPLSAVGIYGVSMRLIHMARNVSLQLNEVLIPLTSRLMNNPAQTHELKAMMVAATRISTGLTAGIALLFIAFGRPFLDLWIGPEVEEAYAPLVILSVSLVIAMAQDMPAKAVYASARHRTGATVTIGGLASNVLLSILLVQWLDIVGVALATLIAWSGAAVVMIAIGCRLAHLPVVAYVRDALVPVLAPVLPAAMLAAGAQAVLPATTWPVLAAECFLAITVYVLASLLLLSSPRELRHFVREGAKTLRNREAAAPVLSGLTSSRRGEEVDVEAVG